MEGQLRIREFRESDQKAAADLILENLRLRFGYIDETLNPDLKDIMKSYISRGNIFVVAELGHNLVGTGALVSDGEDVARIVRIHVSRKHRRCGNGRALVEHLVALALKMGFNELLVETERDWHEAISLYRSCGFEEYRRDDTSVHMSLDLKSADSADRDNQVSSHKTATDHANLVVPRKS